MRREAIHALGEIRAEPDRVLPVLVDALHDPSSAIQDSAIQALQGFGENATIAVPALIDLLNSHRQYYDRALAVKVLKALDREAATKAGLK